MFARIPNKPSSLNTVLNNTSFRGRLAARKTPGKYPPRKRMYAMDIKIRAGITHPETRLENSNADTINTSPATQSMILNCQDCPVIASVSRYIRDSPAIIQTADAATNKPINKSNKRDSLPKIRAGKTTLQRIAKPPKWIAFCHKADSLINKLVATCQKANRTAPTINIFCTGVLKRKGVSRESHWSLVTTDPEVNVSVLLI